MAIRVGVVGAAGRMGADVCRALDATDDLELVAAVDPFRAGSPLREVAGVESDVVVAADLDALLTAEVQVAVEFTGPATVGANLHWLLDHGIHAVVGATGLDDEQLAEARRLAAEGAANALIVPNFAIGAVLMMRFAAEVARHLPHVEIIELHHDRKVDAPSGTALRTAEMISKARSEAPEVPRGDDRHPGARGAEHAQIRVHSVRLPGIIANQEIIFGGEGQTLTIRHDTTDRSSFMPGVLIACREIASLDGVLVGLEHVL